MDEPSPSPAGGSPLGRWAILLVVGVLLCAAALAYLIFHGRGGAPATSPAATAAPPSRKAMVVVPFRPAEASPEAAWIGDAVSIFLTLSLENEESLRVLTPERVFDLTKPGSLSSDADELAMARKGKAEFLLRGRVSPAAGSYKLEGVWLEVSSGREIEHWTVEGVNPATLGAKLDELAGHARTALGLPPLGPEERHLVSLIPVAPEPTRAFVEGWMLLARGDAPAAVGKLNPALEIEDFHLALFLQALAAAQRGDPKTAVAAATPLLKVPRPLPARVTLLSRAILGLYQTGNPRAAVAPLESFLARFPEEKVPLSWLGAIELFLLHEPDHAREALERCVALDPDFAEARRLLGQAMIESGHAREAIEVLQAELGRRPDDTGLRLLLARALREGGRGEEAVRLLDEVLARDPNNVPAVALKGTLLLDGKKAQEAMALYERLASSAQPKVKAEGRALVGRVALLSGRFQKGLNDLRSAADQARSAGLAPLQGQYLMALAQAQAILGRTQEAMVTFSEVRGLEVELDPDLSLINILVMRKDYDTARKLLEEQTNRWRGRIPDTVLQRLRSSLEGNIALQQGDFKTAVARLEAALPPEKSRAPVSESLGRALLSSGEAAKAEPIFRRIVEDPERYSDPLGYVLSLVRLGEACEKQGKKEEALRAYREALAWWGGADFSLPEIQATREGIKRLGG
jgi:tetratricopeptide (TPR) repeat protein/TolB-like protein